MGKKKSRSEVNTQAKIKVPLRATYTGTTVEAKIERKLLCEKCRGRGGDCRKKCTHCKGNGQVYRNAGPMVIQQTCNSCGGKGSILEGNRCNSCIEGITKKKVVIKVEIEKGTKDGTQIQIQGMGDERLDSKTGDLIVQIDVTENPGFDRYDDDLIAEVDLPLATALTGGILAFRNIDGIIINVEVPKMENLNQCIIIENEGFKDKSGRFGRLILNPNIIVPKNIDKKSLLKLFNPLMGEAEVEDIVRKEKSVKGCKKGMVAKMPQYEDTSNNNASFRFTSNGGIFF